MKKKLILGVLAVLLIMPVYQLILQWPDNYLRITFCDVGQGDAILITYRFWQVLIDGGPNDKVLTCLQERMPFWDTTLDLVVATHPDADHIVGLTSVLQQYQVNLILTEISGKKTKEAEAFYSQATAAVEEGAWLILPRQAQQLIIAQKLAFKILWPLEETNEIIGPNSEPTETILSDINVIKGLENGEKTVKNDRSIVLNMEFGDFKVFLPGDLERRGEQALLEAGLINEVNMLKAPHHGSKTSTTPGIAAKLRPEITVISSGKNNQYGHPAPEVIDTLITVGSQIFRTDELGSITFVSDGRHYWLEE